jgi:polysaccharide biosynthesis protein PslH
MRVLFVTPVLERPAAGGPQLRIENSIKALSRVSELDIISNSPAMAGAGGEIAKCFFEPYCHEFHIVPRLRQSLLRNQFIRKSQRIIRQLYQSATVMDANFILSHIDRREIDIVWFGYGNISFPLLKRIKSIRPNLKVVCDTDSVWSRFITRELPYAKDSRKSEILRAGKEKEREEKAWVNLCDVTTAVSTIDMEYYQNIAQDKQRIHLFSNVIDPESYQKVPPAPAGFKNPSIYLAGSFSGSHSPMNTATQWVLDKIFPLVLKDFPNTHFYIVGRSSDKAFGHLNGTNITVTGKVESVLPYLCNTNVILVPLKFESGTRFKILEAGICKKPIVSTVLGAEGIPLEDGKDILLADDPTEFANAIIRVLTDQKLADSLAHRCSELIINNFSIESAATEAAKILSYLTPG